MRRLLSTAVTLALLSMGLLGCSEEPEIRAGSPPSPSDDPGPTVPSQASLLRYVSTTGDDTNPGTFDRPWRTLSHAFGRLFSGQVLFVRGGIYHERIAHVRLHSGNGTSPITVLAYPGENPVVAGTVSLRRPEHWLIDNLDVTGTAVGPRQSSPMVRVVGGHGWSWQDSEFTGTVGKANVMITGWGLAEPAGFKFIGNCLYDLPTSATRSTNLIIGSMTSEARGLVARNVIFNSDGQPNVQIGSSHGVRSRLRVLHNTIYGGSIGIDVRGRPHHVTIGKNVVGGTKAPAPIRFPQGQPDGTKVSNNVAVDAAQLFRPEVRKIVHGFGNVVLGQDPEFVDTTRCSGFRSGLDAMIPYGAFAS